MFVKGELVQGPFWPEVVEIKRFEGFSERYYLIEAIGRRTSAYYPLLLEVNQLSDVKSLTNNKHSKLKTGSDLQHYLQYYVLKLDQKYSESRSLGNKNLIPLPHQIDAVYNRMLQTPQVRFLLADDPGAGKTIMSGMLIRELRARKSVERILILVPPLVLTQWQEELSEKFDEEFTIINRSVFYEYPNQNPFEEFDFCIASMYWAARDDVKRYILDTSFDLVIVDEAHKMAAYTHGKKTRKTTRTSLYRLGESLLPHTPHCLLLTATPHKGDMENYRHLMRLVDSDVFSYMESDETLKDRSNPFIIRRLKEQMVHFDGSPIFPKRKTVTAEFDLTDLELDLYARVTNYVESHFNRAMNNGNNSTAFAMMVLQRRLSSSLEALFLSLKRRKQRLQDTFHGMSIGKSGQDNSIQISEEELSEMSQAEVEKIELGIEGTTDVIDQYELIKELRELDELIEITNKVRENGIERKYIELENTLFDPNGLINRGEKVLIFTEFKDTLNYLYEFLSMEVSQIAIISGDLSIERRRQQVELFRNESPIMLATDAGGESINLQFCNQMINYDIPWNPNRLEQRMGRIHRIGQKNDVLVLNMVAKNTREGDVLSRLLKKMDQMREDLGNDLVYDFIGEILEDQDTDLASIMNEAILNRGKIEEKLMNIEKVLTEEHQKLLKFAKTEALAETGLDLAALRKSHQDVVVKSLPLRAYLQFLLDAFSTTKIRVHESTKRNAYRIDRIPRSIVDFANKQGLNLTSDRASYRFTNYRKSESDEIELLQNDSSLFQLAMELAAQEIQHVAPQVYEIYYPIRERIVVNIYHLSVADGTGRELSQLIKIIGKKADGSFIEIDPYWLFYGLFEKDIHEKESIQDDEFKDEILRKAEEIYREMKWKKDEQLFKKQQFLRRTFDIQYNDISEKLSSYYHERGEQQSIINQLKNRLEEIERRKEERLSEVIREQTVFLRPIQSIMQLVLNPNGKGQERFNPADYLDIVAEYERKSGRNHLKEYHVFSLVDYSSEDSNGNPRYIILSENSSLKNKQHHEDLEEMKEQTYVYQIKDNKIIQEFKLI